MPCFGMHWFIRQIQVAPTPVVTTFQTPSGLIIAYNEPIEVSSSNSNNHVSNCENGNVDQARKKSLMDRIKEG